MPTNIKVELSTASIDNAIKELEAYKKKVKGNCQKIVETLTLYGADIVKVEIVNLAIPDTGYSLSRVGSIYDSATNRGVVFCDCDYAIFIEFGTGTKGQASPYPGQAMAQTAYHYMGGTTYITTKDGRVGWFYPADDGTWKFTEGMPSRPFMFNSAKQIRDLVETVARSVFV